MDGASWTCEADGGTFTELDMGTYNNDTWDVDDDTPDNDGEVPDDITIDSTKYVNTTEMISTDDKIGFWYNGSCGIVELFGGGRVTLC